MREDFAGPEKLGLAPKVLQNLSGSAEPPPQQAFYYEKCSAEPFTTRIWRHGHTDAIASNSSRESAIVLGPLFFKGPKIEEIEDPPRD